MKFFNPSDHTGDASLIEVLPEEIATKVHRLHFESQKSVNVRIGKILGDKVGSPFGKRNYKIIVKATNQGKKYCVVCDNN